MNNSAYSNFYRSLSHIREIFHKSGRFDDSNSKLDEVVKLIAIYLFQLKHDVSGEVSLRTLAKKYQLNDSFDLIGGLRDAFSLTVMHPEFQNPDGTSIFGAYPQLLLQDSENALAFQLIELVTTSIDDAENLNELGNKFDLLNEAFGHFVRDNFRSHIEDAQYMTPPEVVEFMCQVALHDTLTSNESAYKDGLTVVDPCCGVGSFLSTFYKFAKQAFPNQNVQLFGQDKVDRMVRLSKINLMLFDASDSQIVQGNSLVGSSPLNSLNNSVDLILTNPPFGARFEGGELFSQFAVQYPLLFDLARSKTRSFTSELLFIDRCMSLLKPDGIMLAVVPDSVISSKGMAAILRDRLSKYSTIQMIVELPVVTFAQAGTRTKTHVLYARKNQTTQQTQKNVFMGLSRSLGFEVKSRKGVAIKELRGENDLPLISRAYKSVTRSKIDNGCDQPTVLSSEPSCVLVPASTALNNSWTPNHYNATRFNTVHNLRRNINTNIELVPLNAVAETVSRQRRNQIVPVDSRCISVLHVIGEGILNYEEVAAYKPKHQGIKCETEDILFSKINPRIPRVLVVPEYHLPLTCSTEFEVLRSTSHLSNYAIMMLLLSPSSQKQILHLTSGTSSSHNRIKTKELMQVLLPVPRPDSVEWHKFKQTVDEYAETIQTFNRLQRRVVELKPQLKSALFAS